MSIGAWLPLALASGTIGSAAIALSRATASPDRSPSIRATSSVKLITHPSVTFGVKAKAMRRGGRHEDRGRRRKRNGRGLKAHLAAAFLDQKDLEQVAVTMRADHPVVDRRTRRDGFDMDEVECLIVRRIAVQMKQRERGAAIPLSICEAARGANAITRARKRKAPSRDGASVDRVAARQRFCWPCWLPPWPGGWAAAVAAGRASAARHPAAAGRAWVAGRASGWDSDFGLILFPSNVG